MAEQQQPVRHHLVVDQHTRLVCCEARRRQQPRDRRAGRHLHEDIGAQSARRFRFVIAAFVHMKNGKWKMETLCALHLGL